jgi:hypothetical protein
MAHLRILRGSPLWLPPLLSVALGLPLSAQTVITGTVQAADSHSPLANAAVQLRLAGRPVLTDAQGRFFIRGVPVGTYTVDVRLIGYRAASRAGVVVTAGSTATVDLALEPLTVTLAEIVVTPSRFSALEERPVSSATLSREDIESEPQLGEDLYRAITRLPGLSSSDISARFWVRGGPNEELLARLDGLDLVEPFHLKDFDGALSIIDVATIGSLDLTTGGFTTEYGDRLTGVLAMRTLTEDAEGPHTTLGLSITSVRASSRGAFGSGRGHWLVSARRGYLDVALKLIGDNDSISPTYYDGFAKVEYRLSDRHTLAMHALYARDDLTYTETSEPELASGYGSRYAWATWDGILGRNVTVSAVLSYGRLTWRRSGNGPLDGRDTIALSDRRSFDVVGLRQDWTVSLSERALLKGGLDLRQLSSRYDYLNSRQVSFVRNDSLLRRTDTTAVTLRPGGTAAGAYAALRVRPRSALTVEAGVRWDRASYAGGSTLAPRLNAALALTRGTTLRAAWGAYTQAEGIQEIPVQYGDSLFHPPQRAEQRVVGIEQRLPAAVTLRIEAYDRRYTHLRPRWVNQDNSGAAFPELGGDRLRIGPPTGDARGLEVLVERRLGGRFGWSASYALARVGDDSAGALLPRTRDQRHTIVLDATYAPGPAWRFSWSWQYHSGWPYTPMTFALDTTANNTQVLFRTHAALASGRLPAYHRLDVRVSRQWRLRHGTVHAYLDVFNLYNRVNPQGYNYNISVRNGQLLVRPVPDEQLPRLPSLGVTWES